MNVCDTSFERAKTALLRGDDVLDCISLPMEKIRLVFETLSPGIRASITGTDREPGSRSSSYWIIVKGIVRKRIDISKPGSTARQCFYVNAMYLRCSAPKNLCVSAQHIWWWSSKLKNLETGSLSVLVIEAWIPGDKGSKTSLILHRNWYTV